MHLHEYQSKQLLKKYGIPIPDFRVVSQPSEVERALSDLNLEESILKVQVHAGGRGKAGGILKAESHLQAIELSKKLLGMRIINAQTGQEGLVAHQLLITSPVTFSHEYYLGVIINRDKAQAILIASPAGGVEIEEIAHNQPEKVLTLPLSLDGHLRNYQLFRIAKFMGWNHPELVEQSKKIVQGLIFAFIESDALLLEINPLVLTDGNQLVALDAKLSIDENALFRQPLLRAWDDVTQLSPLEVEAKQFDLAYVAMEGNIGCIVNGAGLAMATMDLIHYYGGAAANFLDVGGGASQDKIAEGFKIILSDPKVKALLINIFGGIMNCDTLALGMIAATSQYKGNTPIVIRMEGTYCEEGKRRLKESGLNLVIAQSLSEAAQRVVEESRR